MPELAVLWSTEKKDAFKAELESPRDYSEIEGLYVPAETPAETAERLADMAAAAAYRYNPISDEKVKKIATDMIGNAIFFSTQLRNPHDFSMVFMVVALTPGWWIEAYIREKADIFYEYYSEAGPRSCNGYPCFTSCNIISRDDWNRVFDKYELMKKAMESV